LTITDANLLLGRIIPDYFPKIFGANENEPLDTEATTKAFKELTTIINQWFRDQHEADVKKVRYDLIKMIGFLRCVESKNKIKMYHIIRYMFSLFSFQGKKKETDPIEHLNEDEVAYGFIRVANETMCRPIRNLTEAKGHDVVSEINNDPNNNQTSSNHETIEKQKRKRKRGRKRERGVFTNARFVQTTHLLSVFGGAGPQHACSIARSLGYWNRFSLSSFFWSLFSFFSLIFTKFSI
jgi:N-methylhydantoinase A/oxoprolinase/acetone carboxylase beta subunit